MKKFSYIIKTLAPVTFAEKSNDSVLYATKRFFAGSAVRGALAQKYIAGNKLGQAHTDKVFFDLFLSGKVKFLPAYPIGKIKINDGEPFVVPLSFMRSKDGKILTDLSDGKETATGFKKVQGFGIYCGRSQDSFNFMPAAVDVKTEFHMSRSSDSERVTGKSEDGNVFNYEYIEPGQYFKGSILCDDDAAECLIRMFESLNVETLYFGRSKNSQYGKCAFDITKAEIENSSYFKERKTYLYALTPYIPYSSWQRIDDAYAELVQELEKELLKEGCTTKLKKETPALFAASEEINGYVGVWKAKKVRERAISAGSLIEIDEAVLTAESAAKLEQILYKGFGKGCADGYGQFRIWQSGKNIAPAEDKAVVEKTSLSDEVKKRAAAIIKDRLLNEVRIKAAADVSGEKFKSIEAANNILKRIEGLMYTDKTCDEIRRIIGFDFRSIAKNNLKRIKLEGISIYNLLLEENGCKAPYSGINWAEKAGLYEGGIAYLQAELGEQVFKLSKEEEFKEYWLWFVRHAVKVKKNGNGKGGL